MITFLVTQQRAINQRSGQRIIPQMDATDDGTQWLII